MVATSVGQLASSFGGFLSVCAVMYAASAWSGWATVALAAVAAGFLVRIFIIQHDCGHGAFFKSRRANDAVGVLCSLLTLAPYEHWRRQHSAHHGMWNNLDRRSVGADIYSRCLTVVEYRKLPTGRRLLYRVSRHPLIAVGLLPPLIFLFLYRLPFDTPRGWRHERASVYVTDVAIGCTVLGLGLTLGYERVLLVHLPIMLIASIVGVMLFSVQHRFETALWLREEEWTAQEAALHGSSFLRLPRLLQWFTGSIGFHHVHHLNPRVPNYRLAACHAAIPVLQHAPVLTLAGAWRSLPLALWDEERGRMTNFGGAAPGSMRRRNA
jgi:omega-6 fatty acid desaturase (delta-12 desaturase)